MGSKRFRNKICAYCGEASSTGDHVVARTFFPNELRVGLPEVPACSECNGMKSKLEHYLSTVLPMAGRHSAALNVASASLRRRLDSNASLQRELAAGLERLRDLETPLLFATTFRPDQIEKYASIVARGLLFHHFNVALDDKHESRGRGILQSAVGEFERLYEEVADEVTAVSGEYASGAFAYRGFVAKKNPQVSSWHIQLYQGLILGSSEIEEHGPYVCDLWAITCEKVATQT